MKLQYVVPSEKELDKRLYRWWYHSWRTRKILPWPPPSLVNISTPVSYWKLHLLEKLQESAHLLSLLSPLTFFVVTTEIIKAVCRAFLSLPHWKPGNVAAPRTRQKHKGQIQRGKDCGAEKRIWAPVSNMKPYRKSWTTPRQFLIMWCKKKAQLDPGLFGAMWFLQNSYPSWV